MIQMIIELSTDSEQKSPGSLMKVNKVDTTDIAASPGKNTSNYRTIHSHCAVHGNVTVMLQHQPENA